MNGAYMTAEDIELDLNEDAQGNQQRWLLSYADLVTLLFALFVVLFSSTYAGQKKPVEISKGVREAFGEHAAAVETKSGASAVEKLLNDGLKQAIESGETEIHVEGRGIVIHLKDLSFFNPGDTEILPGAYQTINHIARVIGPLPNLITVEGHSDATAIHNSRFRDNWELSAARSVTMLRYLSETYGIKQERMSAMAFANTRPLSDNASAAGRAQNRRVDIVILNETPEQVGRR